MRIMEILLHFNHQACLSHLCKCPLEQVAFLQHFQVQVVTMTAEHEARLLVAGFWLPALFLADLMAGWQQNCEKAGSQRGCRPDVQMSGELVCDFNMLCSRSYTSRLHRCCFLFDNCASHSYHFNSGIHTDILDYWI